MVIIITIEFIVISTSNKMTFKNRQNYKVAKRTTENLMVLPGEPVTVPLCTSTLTLFPALS